MRRPIAMSRGASAMAIAALLLSGCPVGRIAPDAGPLPDAPAPPDVPVMACDPGEMRCSGTCTNVGTDPLNCGTCGLSCGAGSECVLGACRCIAPRIDCGGVCVDPTSDRAHCGDCDTACDATQMCTRSECVILCDGPGLLICERDEGGVSVPFCADLANDPLNCGRCGTECLGGSSCTGGLCRCPGGGTSCSGSCTDTMTDPLNCGACLSSCGADGVCTGGTCASCGTGLELCGTPSRCVDTSTSRLHCGSCGRACPASAACVDGLCECMGTLTDCGAGCTDTMADVRNCGGCGIDCGRGGVCNAGTCMCASGFTMCGPECADLTRDRDHCGDCATSCGMGMTCRASVCVPADSFRVTGLLTTGCRVTEHEPATGDDRGGVAVSGTTFFVTGDSTTGRMSAADLSGPVPAAGARHDAMVSDVESETVYVLLDAAGREVDYDLDPAVTVTQLGVLDPTTGALTAARVPLSTPIPVDYETAIMSGYVEALLGVPDLFGASMQWWHIELSSGTVTRLGTTPVPDHAYCESWAFWGIAETFGDVHYAVFVGGTGTDVVRLTVPTTGTSMAAPVTLASFTNLSDMCSITFSTSRDRWYFHHEYDSQFGGDPIGETAGYCDATWDRP